MFDWKHKVMLALILTGLAGGVLAFRTWLSEHDARLQAEERSKAKDQVIAQNQQALQSLGALIEQVRQDNAKQVAALQETVAALKTPDEQLAWIVSHIQTQPGQPPITINVPKNPEQPAMIEVPQARVPEVTEAVKGCDQCKLDLTAKTQELTYTQQQNQRLADSLKQETDKAEMWENTAKGGSFWQRFGRAVKWISIGAGAAAGAICGSGHCRH